MITVDHNVATELEIAGLRADDVPDARGRLAALSSFLGGGDAWRAFSVRMLDIRGGDRLVVCSDGVHRHVSVDVWRAAAATSSCQDLVDHLVASVRRARGPDDATALGPPPRRRTVTADRAASSPMSSGATSSSRVSVVPGEGFLVRRPNALFFSPVEPRDPRVAALLEAFEAAPDDASASTAVTDAVVAAAFDAAPFAVVSWTGGLEVVVLGGVEVRDGSPGAPDAVGRRLRFVGRAPARCVRRCRHRQRRRARRGALRPGARPGSRRRVRGDRAAGVSGPTRERRWRRGGDTVGGTGRQRGRAPTSVPTRRAAVSRALPRCVRRRAATGWKSRSVSDRRESAAARGCLCRPRRPPTAGRPSRDGRRRWPATSTTRSRSVATTSRCPRRRGTPPAWPGDPATAGRRSHVDPRPDDMPRARTG